MAGDGETNCNPDGSCFAARGLRSVLPEHPRRTSRRTFHRDVHSERPSFRQPEFDADSRLDWELSLGIFARKTSLVFEAPQTHHESGTFLRKYFDTPFSKQETTRYQASSKNSLLGRASDAAARILVTRDEMGRRRVNTSYVVSVLTSVAAHNASRPYWARSNPNPIGDIGSTVGNDAGMNLMHEFGPGLRQAVAGHMPSFVFRVERRIVRNVNPPSPIAGPR